jgi:hypothetical protein
MKKQHVLDVFGGTSNTATVMGLTRQAVSAWPEDLPPRTVDQLIGVAFRAGKMMELLDCSKIAGGKPPKVLKTVKFYDE